jgi:hypothetical protein
MAKLGYLVPIQSDLALVLGFWWAGQLKQDRKGGSAMRNAGWS